MNKKIMQEFKIAYEFLVNHPAFCECFEKHLWVTINNVCKNGIDESFKEFHYISAPYNKKNKKRIKKFQEAWEKFPQYRELIECSNDGEEPYRVNVPYEEYYGMKWEYYKTEVNLEIGASFIYNHDGKRGISSYGNEFDVYGNSYEQAIIKLAKQVKVRYGNFDDETVVDSWVADYNKNKEFCIHDGDKIILNPDWLGICPAMTNLFWWYNWAKSHLPKLYKDFMEYQNGFDISEYDTPEKLKKLYKEVLIKIY